MRNMLISYYGIQIKDEITVRGDIGYKDNEYTYFTITVDNKKAIYSEQTALADYIAERGHFSIGIPIPNLSGEWITQYDNNYFIVVKVARSQIDSSKEHGALLAYFHRVHGTYEYEPRHISSYGHWKSLWINKLTLFEEQLTKESKEHSNSYYRLVMDTLPYIIGISENAIQYIRESEQEVRHDASDAGTIAFWRYEDHLLREVIWLNDLVYDHPVRDIAEYIRKRLHSEGGLADIELFIKEYESVQPLSPFSWRLLYGRLIYPIHIFTLLEEGLRTSSFEGYYSKLDNLLKRQESYLTGVKKILEGTERSDKRLYIPRIQWL